MSHSTRAALCLLALAATAACSAAPQSPAAVAPGVEAPRAAPAPATVAAVPAALPAVLVHKTPSCGCCTGWVEHMRQAGFRVEVQESADLTAIKARLGIPADKASCHTAEIGGIVVEGHVPAADVKRLLAEGGDARGLVLPGMPLGSPGMEVPDGRVEPYTVERLDADGRTSPFAEHGPATGG